MRSIFVLAGILGGVILATLTDDCTETFARFTEANVGRQIALVVDGEVFSAPVVREPITGGKLSLDVGPDDDARATLERLRQK